MCVPRFEKWDGVTFWQCNLTKLQLPYEGMNQRLDPVGLMQTVSDALIDWVNAQPRKVWAPKAHIVKLITNHACLEEVWVDFHHVIFQVKMRQEKEGTAIIMKRNRPKRNGPKESMLLKNLIEVAQRTELVLHVPQVEIVGGVIGYSRKGTALNDLGGKEKITNFKKLWANIKTMAGREESTS